MTVSTNSQPIRKAPLFTPYVVVWSMLGALSFGFLMVLGLAPEWLDDLRPSTTMGDPQNNQGQRAAARLAADVGQMKNSIEQIQLDISKVKTDVEQQGAQQKAVSEQVASLETRISAALPAAALEASTPVAPSAAPAPGNNIGSSDAPKSPVKTLKVINAETTAAGAALETGSVSRDIAQVKPAKSAVPVKASAEATAFDTAVVKSAPNPLGVKISTGASVDSLRLSWNLLAEKHGDQLSSLEPRYTSAGDPANPTFDLVAGPIASKAEATKLCKTLAARGVACTVGGFKGNAL